MPNERSQTKPGQDKSWTKPEFQRIGRIADVALVGSGLAQCDPGGQQCNRS